MTPGDSDKQTLCGSPSWDAEQSFHVILILSTPSNPVCDDDSLWTRDECSLSEPCDHDQPMPASAASGDRVFT